MSGRKDKDEKLAYLPRILHDIVYNESFKVKVFSFFISFILIFRKNANTFKPEFIDFFFF